MAGFIEAVLVPPSTTNQGKKPNQLLLSSSPLSAGSVHMMKLLKGQTDLGHPDPNTLVFALRKKDICQHGPNQSTTGYDHIIQYTETYKFHVMMYVQYVYMDRQYTQTQT